VIEADVLEEQTVKRPSIIAMLSMNGGCSKVSHLTKKTGFKLQPNAFQPCSSADATAIPKHWHSLAKENPFVEHLDHM
jgi:hypothetical protein